MSDAAERQRYTVISSDGHAGAPMDLYKVYLESRFHDEYEAWRAEFQNPFGDLVDTESRDYKRNFDSSIRQSDIEADGIAGEILFPNTIPPFFNGSPFFGAPDPKDARELELRWAGIRAHNRWLVDFCGEVPGRRAGIAQILLDDVDTAVAELQWVREQGLMGGVLLPNPNADSSVPQLHAPGLRAALDGVRIARPARQHSRQRRGTQPRRVSVDTGDDVPRVRLVCTAPARAADVQRCVRASPRLEVRDDRDR